MDHLLPISFSVLVHEAKLVSVEAVEIMPPSSVAVEGPFLA